MRCVTALMLAWLAGAGLAAEQGGIEMEQTAASPSVSRKPFWISSGSAMAPLGGWAIVAGENAGATPSVRPKRFLVQGTMFENRFETYDVTNVQGLAIYPPGAIVFRDRFANLQRRGTLAEVLKELERYHGSLRKAASDAVPEGTLLETGPDVLRTSVESATGTLLVRYGFMPKEGSPAASLYHHVDAVVFYDLEGKKLVKAHVFPVPLE